MTSPDRLRVGFREVAELVERRYAPVPPRGIGLGRLLQVLWYMTVGKQRFVASGPDPKWVRKQKKRERQNRRRYQHRPR
jgi:hypothetical protein